VKLDSVTLTICVIATSPTVDKDVAEKISAVLSNSMAVRKETYLQATAGVSLEVIEIVFVFSSTLVAKGFLEELGKDTYGKLKQVLKQIFSRREERALVIDFKSKETRITFRVETEDEAVVEVALQAIPKVISKARTSTSYYWGKRKDWEPSEGKVAFVRDGVAATTDEFELNGRKVRFTERALEQAARNMPPNFPIMSQHRGKPIGKITKSWVQDGKLLVRMELYQPRNAEEEQVIQAIKSGDLHLLSLGFSFPEEN
jgi:hypothetical protein